jgi:hypothetical protein
MSNEQEPGIRTSFWIGNRHVFRGPAPLGIVPRRFDAKTRTSNLGLRVDRPYLGAGLPNIRSRHDLNMPWRTVQEPVVIEHLDILTNTGQPFDIAVWKHVYDVFDGDGTTKTFYLQRRQIPEDLYVTAYLSYPTRAIFYDAPYSDPAAGATEKTVVQKTTAEMSGTPSAGEVWIEETGHRAGGLWLSTVKCAEAPDDAFDSFVVAYMPLYSMVIEQEQPRQYSDGMIEPRGWQLQEIG